MLRHWRSSRGPVVPLLAIQSMVCWFDPQLSSLLGKTVLLRGFLYPQDHGVCGIVYNPREHSLTQSRMLILSAAAMHQSIIKRWSNSSTCLLELLKQLSWKLDNNFNNKPALLSAEKNANSASEVSVLSEWMMHNHPNESFRFFLKTWKQLHIHVMNAYEPCHEKTCLREFPVRSDSNWPAQLQKLAWAWNFGYRN